MAGSTALASAPLDMKFAALIFAGAMTMLAGFVDAVGYAQLGNLYLSFMSGNSTRLGFAVAGAHIAEMLRIAGLIGLFVLGAAIGTWVGDRRPPSMAPCILAFETVLFCVADLCSWIDLGPGCLMLLAIAMGMQNLLHRCVWSADIGKGFVTGALVNVGQDLARIAQRGRSRAALILVSSWVIFVSGVAIGACALAFLGIDYALLFGVVLFMALTVASITSHVQQRSL